jgi:hypothetical protein
MLSRRILSAAAGLLLAVTAVGLEGAPVMAAQPHLSCTSASAWDIVPTGGGATYSIAHGSGFCLQGAPYKGDWSVTYSGSGSAATFSCTPAGGSVSGLVLTINMNFHNNLTGVDTAVTETWTQLLPVAPYNSTTMKVQPGNSTGQVLTHIFNQCPPAGTPSTYLIWNDNNAN